jgi:hypothetical protein
MQPWQCVKPEDIPSELIYKHPIVDELTDAISMNTGTNVSIPYVIENATLMSPGTWNGYFYSDGVIKSAFGNTDWKMREVRSLFLDHKDKEVPDWVGEIRNEHMDGKDLKGDLYIFDPITAIKLAYGKPRFGISPKVRGNAKDNSMQECIFENFSIVINPACKTTYLNRDEKKDYDGIYINQEVGKMPETTLEAEPVIKSELAAPAVPPVAEKAAEKKEYPEPTKKDEKYPKEEKKTDEMSDFRTLLKELASLVEQLKGKPAPEIPKEKMEDKEMNEMKTVIKEMKEEIKELKGEPEKLNVKAYELADQTANNADVAMLKFLQGGI